MPDRPSPLVGRQSEQDRLFGLLAGIRDQGGAVRVTGPAGIGKSALLAAAGAQASAHGMAQLRATGVHAESQVPYSGLHQLLWPVANRIEAAPSQSRAAIQAALGLDGANVPDGSIVALAVLELMSDLAAEAPVLVTVDDAHWIDPFTIDVLGFLCRRVEPDPIAVILSTRDGEGAELVQLEGIANLPLAALGSNAAAELFDRQAGEVEAAVRARLLDEADGNPLALIELPALLDELPSGTQLPEWLPLTARLERSFAARVDHLTATTQTLLLVAALNQDGTLAETLTAASRLLGSVMTDADLPAEAASLAHSDGRRIRFRHPLIASAIHQRARESDRRAANAALADSITGQAERSAWHRAASIVGPDEDVADELERLADQVVRRWGARAALDAQERAAELTHDPESRARRLLRAAELAFQLGRRDIVVRVAREAEPLGIDALQRERLRWLQDVFEEDLSLAPGHIERSVRLADETREAGNTSDALDYLLTAALTCWWSHPTDALRERVAVAAERVAVPPSHAKLLSILAFSSPVRRGADLLDRLHQRSLPADTDPEESRLLSTAAVALGALDLAPRFFAPAVEGLRRQGRLGLLARALVSQAWAEVCTGRWTSALAAADEAERLASETSQPRWQASARLVQSMIAALRGDAAAAELLAGEAERLLIPTGASSMLSLVAYARGTAALATGRAGDAFEHLTRMFDPADSSYHPFLCSWVLFDLAEASLGTPNETAARQRLEAMAPAAEESRSRVMEVGMVCSRAILCADEGAEDAFLRALETDLDRWPFHRARVLFFYGAWLRRGRRVAESRAPLRAARDIFDALGAQPWAERARGELRASGERSQRAEPELVDELTPQERHIAELAAEGLTNREIGARLFLSHRTVGAHLYRTFPKLGIHSRGQLRAALGTDLDRPAGP